MGLLKATSRIAPCGMNCSVCFAYLREKNKCPGCRGSDIGKPKTRSGCKIKTCDVLVNEKFKFCFQCDGFPCDKLNYLDKRYRTKYHMSTIGNLENINKLGIRSFLLNERSRWTCPTCGGTICVHKGICSDCGKKK
jgi:hypothetical protein